MYIMRQMGIGNDTEPPMPKVSNDNRPPFGRAWWSESLEAAIAKERADLAGHRDAAACRRLGRVAASRLRDLAALGIPMDIARKQVMSLLDITAPELDGYVARHRDVSVARQRRRRIGFVRLWHDRGVPFPDIAARLGLSEVEVHRLLRQSSQEAGGGA
jgi:hypothetical protein